MFSAQRITNDNYIIGNEEYGYRLCKLSIYQEMREELSDDKIQEIANELARLISSAVAEVQAE